jgi:hypothetical protein
MAESSASGRIWLSRREAVRIAALLAAGATVGVAMFALLLPTWHDARIALALALGRSPQDINEAVRNEPLPTLPPGSYGPVKRPLPPRPRVDLPLPGDGALGGGPTPFGEGTPRYREYEMQKRQYEFYMSQLRRARAKESSHTPAQPASVPLASDSRP